MRLASFIFVCVSLTKKRVAKCVSPRDVCAANQRLAIDRVLHLVAIGCDTHTDTDKYTSLKSRTLSCPFLSTPAFSDQTWQSFLAQVAAVGQICIPPFEKHWQEGKMHFSISQLETENL